MTPRTIAERADALARATGIPALVEGAAPRRPLRWWPIGVLALAAAGVAVTLAAPARTGPGIGVLGIALALAALVRARGPLVPAFGPDHLDERERALLHLAYARTGFAVGVVAPIALILLVAGGMAAGWDRDAMMRAVAAAALFQMVAWSVLPTLFASWTMAPLDEVDA